MESVLYFAGMYFREDVLEGSEIAALISVVVMCPAFFIRDAVIFRKVTDWIAAGCLVYFFFGVFGGSLCAGFWQIALSFFFGVGLSVLAVLRFLPGRREKGWATLLGAVVFAFIALGFVVFGGLAVIPELVEAFSGEAGIPGDLEPNDSVPVPDT